MRKLDFRLLISFVSLLVLTLACSSFSLPGGGGGGNGNAKVLLKDDFSKTGNWGTGTDSDSSVEYTNGGLQFIVYSGYYITWSNPDTKTYQNYHVEASVKNESPDPLAIFGFICHEQETQSFYYLGVAADGYYTISKSQSGQDDVTLTKGDTTAVPAGGGDPFTIGADCGNGNLALYVNGQQVATAQDTSFTSGKVGLFAWTDKQTDGANVTFDNFVMTELPQ
jgi:hypothetical protein